MIPYLYANVNLMKSRFIQIRPVLIGLFEGKSD